MQEVFLSSVAIGLLWWAWRMRHGEKDPEVRANRSGGAESLSKRIDDGYGTRRRGMNVL